jgi:hypothetical protein
MRCAAPCGEPAATQTRPPEFPARAPRAPTRRRVAPTVVWVASSARGCVYPKHAHRVHAAGTVPCAQPCRVSLCSAPRRTANQPRGKLNLWSFPCARPVRPARRRVAPTVAWVTPSARGCVHPEHPHRVRAAGTVPCARPCRVSLCGAPCRAANQPRGKLNLWSFPCARPVRPARRRVAPTVAWVTSSIRGCAHPEHAHLARAPLALRCTRACRVRRRTVRAVARRAACAGPSTPRCVSSRCV